LNNPTKEGTILLPVHELYSDYVFKRTTTAPQFWGPIPNHVEEALNFAHTLISKYQQNSPPIYTSERYTSLLKILREIHQKRGHLTDQVKAQLERIETTAAVIEAGHQPAILGGPGFIINKIATIAQLAKYQNLIPLMFVGEHDHEQKELTVSHLPSPGQKGLTFSQLITSPYRQSPLHVIPKPPKKWLQEVIQKIQSTYHEQIASVPKNQRSSYDERVEITTTLIQSTYDKASSLSDWALRIWMHIANGFGKSGVLFQRFAHPSIRLLMLPAFEHLLTRKIRVPFIEAINQVAEQLQNLGYEPGIGFRDHSYVPFLLECPTKGCNRTRLEPTLNQRNGTTTITITATCHKCKETHILEVLETKPDLSSWKTYLSPRVDTREFLVRSYTPVILHVGGPGEASYYAQVSSALRTISIFTPVFYRYTRMFYQNPWSEKTATKLQRIQFPTIDQNKIKQIHSKVQENIQKQDAKAIKTLYASCADHLQATFSQLVKEEQQIEAKRSDLIEKLQLAEGDSDRKPLQKQIGQLTRTRNLIQVYLSQMFGRYAPERYGQEVSFTWIDMAISLDPHQIFRRLASQYSPFTPPAATYYLW
jgi:uncharacterized protein YllA (UPF0747 family)